MSIKQPVIIRAIEKKKIPMRKLRSAPEIVLERCQIKDIFTAREVARALDILEKRVGIRSVWITLRDCFICPDITERELATLDRTATGRLVHHLIDQVRQAELSNKRRKK